MRRPLTFLVRALLLGVALLCVLVAGQAFAQPKAAKPPPPTLAELQEAARQSEVGNRLFNLGVFETAVTHFQKAYDLAHKPADLQKVAECDKALGQTGAAYDAYTQLLTLHGPALGFTGAVAVKKAIAELEGTTGTLTVHSTPDGATVRVGERVVGVTPFAAPVRLAMGPVRVEVSKDGFEPFIANAAIDPAHPFTVDATLSARALTGHLAVSETHAASAHLLLDGQDVGPLPWEGDVPPGIHQLAIQATDLKAEPQTIKVPRGSKIAATFTADFTVGQLQVTATPEKADIALDGKSIGTGKFEGPVAVGDHALRVSLDGYKPVEKPITVSPQATVTVEAPLERIITAEEIAAAQAARDAEAIRGFYGQFAVFGAWPPVSTHIGCDQATQPVGAINQSCSPGFVWTGGATLRGGYSWGIFGVELIGGFMYDRQEDDVTYTSTSTVATTPTGNQLGAYPHSEAYTLVGMTGLAALGPRLTTAGRTFRLTLGAAGGVAIRNVALTRSLSNGVSESSGYSDSETAISPAILGDLGFIIGSTPGVNFVIGGMAWVELPSQTQSTPQSLQENPGGGTTFSATSGPYTVLNGPQVYIGPYLGLRFGH